ncbi:hypothetical protein E2562_016260 [Oryza meyeriana var. granulata]|uniref:Late embryogenesis abundant protein LEA-2 subgroup domain-containing protein n=1 Tax=Oryza meyeriana var. granulata TaxID=110450 RepID=A0A6G1CPA4_9ORYZ|nr:hypothetical protein E2562_016260 [Oryza meyeriana var. granulata]
MHNEKKETETEEEEETFRWLDLVRCAAAAVVALLAVGVLVWAILVVLRPDELAIKVTHGSVLVRLPPPKMMFTFQLEADNPSGRASMSFTNISIAVSSGNESIATLFNTDDIKEVPPGMLLGLNSVQSTKDPTAEIGDYFVERLSRGETMDVTLRVQGELTTKLVTLNGDGPVHNSRANVIYTCLNIKLGVDKSLNYADDVSCTRKY